MGNMEEKFASFKKIDAHLHFNVANRAVLQVAERQRFSLVTVNVDFPEFGSLKKQYATALQLTTEHPQTVRFISSFSMRNWQDGDWLANTLQQIEKARLNGALAVKIWKNIGMGVRDDEGRLLFLDDARLDALFHYLEDNEIVVLMHQGEPKNCWLPVEKMNLRYDREYFRAHPEHHFYLHADMPSYEQLLAARDRRLMKNPRLKTVQAHLASLEWSVERLAEFLERFPNAVVDTAARMNHLMFQARDDWEKVLAFFVRYQDRILYASDFFIMPQNAKRAAHDLEALWRRDWIFLSRTESMETDDFDGGFYGLGLNEEILRKIYFENAQRVFKLYSAEKVGMAHV
jgi:predicted TIM-barrel fold metal-dependent hydrolase